MTKLTTFSKTEWLSLVAFILFLLPSVAFSQVGPMGIGNKDGTATPAGPQPKLLLWLDGSSVNPYVNNSLVDSWIDKSGNGHTFFPLGTHKPRLGTTTGPKLQPSVLFLSGTGNQLTCPDFELPDDGYTIYFVIKTDDDKYGLFSYANFSALPPSEREMVIYNDNGFHQQMHTHDRISAIGDLPNNIWNYGGIAWSNADDKNWEYSSGVAHEAGYSTFNGVTISSTGGSAMIGDIQNVSGTYPSADKLTGYIAEIFIYEGRLSRPATRLLSTYLYVKYGLTGPSPAITWDKYHGNYDSTWAGKYYAPIGIGNDNINPNAGSHNEARSAGLVLRVNSWTQSTSYLCAAPVGNSITGLEDNLPIGSGSGSLPATVLQRWSRLWEISGNSEGNTQEYEIAFDFGEGIDGGKKPQNAENYVLLSRNSATSGTFTIVPVLGKSILDDELVFRIEKSNLTTANRFYTIGTTDLSSPLTGSEQRTWYAYQTGNWDNPQTWTLDGSAAPLHVNPGGLLPDLLDNIYIGTGRTVTVNTTLPLLNNLKVYGTLDVATAAKPSFQDISGSGLIKCAAGNFPTGTSTSFADPINGGTLEFYGTNNITQSTPLVVNKLKINLSAKTKELTLATNLTTNGLFEVNRGTLIINNSADSIRTIISNARVLVEGQGRIWVSSTSRLTKHKWFFYNDLINNGDVRFTNRTVTSDEFYTTNETQNIVEAYFSSGSKNQELRANGVSYFSRIIINKGIDDTYILSINSNGNNKFKLLGKCNVHMPPASYTNETVNQNSFALVNGTVEIKERIFIPLQYNVGNGLIYNINETAQLWVNGGEVTKGPFGGDGKGSAIVNYGIIKVSGSTGKLNAICSSGITIRDNGVIQVDGGTVNTQVIRTSFLGIDQIGGVIINGGVVNVNGDPDIGFGNGGYHTFCLTYPGNLFQMTGGKLNVTGPSPSGLLFINSDPQNTSVSGGEVNLKISTTSNNYKISSRAAFWDLNLTRSIATGSNNFRVVSDSAGDAGAKQIISNQDLIVRNSLKISGPNNPTLDMGSSATDLYVYKDLTINAGSVYKHNNNTTHFVGSPNSSLTFGSNTPFYNVVVNKDFDSRTVEIQNSSAATSMNILGNLKLEKGYFINNTRSVEVKGNVTNRTQFGDSLSTGFLRMNGSGQQEIISEGGVFHKLYINNSDGVVLKNDGITIKQFLKLESGSFFIGDNKLRLETKVLSPIESYNPTNKFIVCSGNASAGGIEILNHEADQHLTYPFGVSTATGQKYTPADVYVNSGWTDEGFIRIAPVDTLLSTADITVSTDYLNYYWRVSSSGYSTNPNVTHVFKYLPEDIRPLLTGSDAYFESGRVLSTLPFTRSIDNDPVTSVDHASDLIYYNGADPIGTSGTGTLLVNADYTAGVADRFPDGSPEVFFSRNSTTVGAAWQTPGNWNKLSDCTGCSNAYDYHSITKTASTSDYPQKGDIAVIGFDVDNPYRPHVYKAPPGGIEAAHILFTPLQDVNGNRQERYESTVTGIQDIGILRPTLQISKTSDIINVAQISGEGALMLTGENNSMLNGDIDLGVTDIGGFLAEDSSIVVIKHSGTVEAQITLNFLPAVVPNLFIGLGAPTITSDIHIRGNLEVAGRSALYLSETQKGNIEIGGNLILAQYQLTSGIRPRVLFNKRGTLKTITVHGDLKLSGTVANIGISNLTGIPIVPVPWTPAVIGALIWLDAQDDTKLHPSPTPGSSISGWDNKASGLYNATQTTPANQPTYNSAGINGYPTIKFDGGDDFLSILHNVELNMSPSQNFEIFSVVKQNGNLGQRLAIYAKGMTSSKDFLLYSDLNKYRLYVNQTGIDVTSPVALITNPNLGWARRQGNTAFTYNTIGGSKDGSVGDASNQGNTHDVTIGAAESGTVKQRFFDGEIAEIILVKRALTDEDRTRMEGYLAHRWGLESSLRTGHPYKDEIPYIGGNGNQPAQLIVHGDIIQNTGTGATDNGINLYDPNDFSFVNLVLAGDGNNEFKNTSGRTPKLWKVTLDKGINTSSSFTFNTNVIIDGPADEFEKPVNIKHGLLKFNNSSIDVTLSSGGEDFRIPVTGGLELNNGNLHITGHETGLLLSGLLKITGGSFTIAEEDENNYIEYAASDVPKINITGGTLTVGSQIRRGLSSFSGSLDYRQSGGNVIIGRYSAPETSRGMLEVLNSGHFEHTGGSLTFVRGINLGSTPSLLITPLTSNVGGASEIIIGSVNSPAGAAIQNFGIQSNIALNALTINTTSSPVVHLITNDLELNSDLTIHTGATLNCDSWNLTLHEDVANDGTLSSVSGKVSLIHPGSATVSGSGIFDLHDLERSGGINGNTLVQTNLLVKNDFVNDNGEMDFQGNTLTVKGDVTTDGELKFDAASNGLVFSGSESQILRRTEAGTSKIDVMTITNDLGVTIPAGYFHFIINKNLRLEKGIFGLTGNLLEMASGSKFTAVTPFSISNMIVTGGAFANFGILMHVPANTQDDVYVPLGIDRYMPINLDFSQPGYSSGTTASTYLLRLNIPENGVVIEDIEDPGPQIVDKDNVLGMYFSVDGTDIGNGLKMDMKFHYDEKYVQVTAPFTEGDYTTAWVHADNTTISKLGPSGVDEINNILTFHADGNYAGNQYAVDGDYFAGLDAAIPSTILVYTTSKPAGNVNAGYIEYLPDSVPGGGAPAGALVIVSKNQRLIFNINNVNFYRTHIDTGATVVIKRGFGMHRLGKVTGTGTIELEGSGNLPAGDYTDFFGCSGGKLRFRGQTGDSYEILSNMPPIKAVTILGAGDITIADNAVNICDSLTISGPQVQAANSSLLNIGGALLVKTGNFDFRQGNVLVTGDIITSGGASTGGMVHSGNLGKTTIKGDLILGGRSFGLGTDYRETHVEGDVIRNTGTITEGTGGAEVVFDGIVPQTITGDFTIANSSRLPSIEINNTTGLTLSGNVDVSDTLKLTDGNIFTSSGNTLKLTSDGTIISPHGGRPNSFVEGPMQWTLTSGVAERTFPVGKNDRFRPLSLDNPSADANWEVEYYDTRALDQFPLIITSMDPNSENVPTIKTVSVQEHWRVNSNGVSNSSNVRLSWGNNSAVSSDPSDFSSLVVLGYNTDDDVWDSYGGGDFLNLGYHSFLSATPVTFSERFLTLGSSDRLNPLPVTWLYFNGENKGEDNILSWATATEKNNDYFQLERSLDAHNWISIAQVYAAGYSTTKQTYNYTDKDVPFGRVYYRLKQVDFDAKEEYAPNVVSLERGFTRESEKFDFLLYPNPTQIGTVQFRMSSMSDVRADVSIYDLSGKFLSQSYVQVDGQGTSAPIDCNLEPGIYLVTVIVNDKMRSKPLVVTM